jgi:hypothetical protein
MTWVREKPSNPPHLTIEEIVGSLNPSLMHEGGDKGMGYLLNSFPLSHSPLSTNSRGVFPNCFLKHLLK